MAEEYAAVHQSTTLPITGPTPGKNTLTGGSAESLMMGVFAQRRYWNSRHRDILKRINALERKVEPTPMVFRALLAA